LREILCQRLKKQFGYVLVHFGYPSAIGFPSALRGSEIISKIFDLAKNGDVPCENPILKGRVGL
jgi:hypothetical protein